MYKKLISLFTVLSIATIEYANSQGQDNPYSNPYEAYENIDANAEVAQGGGASSSDPRWYKYREGRQEYLKGGSDYPYKQGQYDSRGSYQNPSGSDPRWYKSREGRQEYLKGGSDYPYKQGQYDSGDQYAPSSDSRWYKSRSGRQEYLKGGSDYPKGQY
jgi:hypothetical protein